jgi:hypothetical protein
LIGRGLSELRRSALIYKMRKFGKQGRSIFL